LRSFFIDPPRREMAMTVPRLTAPFPQLLAGEISPRSHKFFVDSASGRRGDF
jgi:hypothetical protein